VANKPALGQIHEQIIALLKENPEGLSEPEMRAALGLKSGEQIHFGRRRRQLYAYHRISQKRIGTKVVYVYDGPREQPLSEPANDKLRAQALHAAHGRCGMCGKTIAEDGIKLVVDHRTPLEWGGKSVPENLWAICVQCNQGKKNFFESVDSPAMRAAMQNESVHVRIGEFLKGMGVGVMVPSYMIDVVADQDEWRKRLRELRYLRWVIKASRKKLDTSRRFQSAYTLEKFTEWPPDPTGWIQKYEQDRKKRNKQKKG
jgi:5-methylcytosine-specific restriction endonuclease McrA